MSAKKLRLDQLLSDMGLAGTRTKAAAMVMAGQVKVDGKIQDKPGFFVHPDVKIDILNPSPYVSRGGDKLASVAGQLGLDFKNKTVLDIGASTGGFSDFALQHGAQKVYAVDVGTGQLDWKLRQDERVIVMEKTDIRNVESLPDTPDIVVIDVSFISLNRIWPAVIKLISSDSQVVAMAKPHFEADPATASKNKGVIKNDTIRRAILKNVEAGLRTYFVIKAKADSKVSGRKGNVERFYLLRLARH